MLPIPGRFQPPAGLHPHSVTWGGKSHSSKHPTPPPPPHPDLCLVGNFSSRGLFSPSHLSWWCSQIFSSFQPLPSPAHQWRCPEELCSRTSPLCSASHPGVLLVSLFHLEAVKHISHTLSCLEWPRSHHFIYSKAYCWCLVRLLDFWDRH